MNRLLPIIPIIWLTATAAFAAEVEATGSAPGDVPEARAQALSDALREAVRTGAGVDLVSETQATNFALDYDRTFSKARGYVRKYEVVDSKLREDGIYTVTIKADVGELAAGAGDKLTFQMMAREHQAPRVSIQVTENIAGVSDSKVATDWLGNTASECGLKVVDVSRSQGAMSARAEALGRKQEAALRSHGVVSTCDYIIEGEITGSLAGEQSFYGSKPAKRFSLGANLRVIDAATGLVILAETVPSRDILIRQVASDAAASREAIRQLLEGSPRLADSDSGWKLIRRIFSCWAAETDLGATIRMEFSGMDAAKASMLKEKLAGQKGVGATWIRSVDAAGVSVIDCESRLDSTTLANVVCGMLPGFTLDRSDRRYLSFLGKSVTQISNSSQSPSSDTSGEEDVSYYIYVGGAALAVALAFAFFFLKPRK